MAVLREGTARVGLHKNLPRWYAQGRHLITAGFLPGTAVALTVAASHIELRPSASPTGYSVSQKQAGAVAVIDLQAEALRDVFGIGAVLYVRVEDGKILLSRHPIAELQASRPRDGSMVGAFVGGGTLDAAAVQAGFTPRAAIEIDPGYADLYARNHPTARVLNMSIHEALYVDLPRPELVCAGICCEPWSTANRVAKGTGGQKRDKSLPATAHPLGDLSLWTFAVLAKLQPRTIVLEEAPRWVGSETGVAFVKALERMGYTVSHRVLSPHEVGYVARRPRSIVVAQTPDADGTVPSPWPPPRPTFERVRDFLDRDVPESAWFNAESKPWLFEHAAKQAAKGNGFGLIVVREDDIVLPVIKKRYFAGQGDSAVLAHPSRDGVYRWFTIAEIRRVHHIPSAYDLGESKTHAGEILGQGVHVGLLADIIRRATGRDETAARQSAAASDITGVACGAAAACGTEDLPLFAELGDAA